MPREQMKKFMTRNDGQNPRKECDRDRQQKKKKKRELERGNVPAVSAVLVHVGEKNKSTPGKSKPYAPIGTIAALKEWNERLLLPVRDSKCHWIDTLEVDDDESPKLWWSGLQLHSLGRSSRDAIADSVNLRFSHAISS
jgi:hypothetical protein